MSDRICGYFISVFDQWAVEAYERFSGDRPYPDGFHEWPREKKALWMREHEGRERTFGWFADEATARQAVAGNWCDMHELSYVLLLIECLREGVCPDSSQVAWFAWAGDGEEGEWVETTQPNWAKTLCNFAVG